MHSSWTQKVNVLYRALAGLRDLAGDDDFVRTGIFDIERGTLPFFGIVVACVSVWN